MPLNGVFVSKLRLPSGLYGPYEAKTCFGCRLVLSKAILVANQNSTIKFTSKLMFIIGLVV